MRPNLGDYYRFYSVWTGLYLETLFRVRNHNSLLIFRQVFYMTSTFSVDSTKPIPGNSCRTWNQNLVTIFTLHKTWMYLLVDNSLQSMKQSLVDYSQTCVITHLLFSTHSTRPIFGNSPRVWNQIMETIIDLYSLCTSV